jgi:hypothetical protein
MSKMQLGSLQMQLGSSGQLTLAVPNAISTMNGASKNKKQMRRKQPLSLVTASMDTIYTLPCLDDKEYIAQMTPEEREWAESLLNTTDEEIVKLREVDQKAPDWYIGRKKRMTGSKGPAAVGHNPYSTMPEAVEEWVTGKSKRDNPYSQKIMQNGTDMEPVARQEYEVQMNEALRSKLTRDWNAYEKSHQQSAQPFVFYFRGIAIPIRYDSQQKPITPVLTVIEKGLLIDKDRRWRGVSLDGIVMIDDLFVWVLEIKCPQKSAGAFYTQTPLYYYDQIQNNIWTALYHFDLKLPMCDLFIFSEQGFALEMFELDREYMVKWFLPRESRCFFKAYLPRQVEHLREMNLKSVPTITTVSASTITIETNQICN